MPSLLRPVSLPLLLLLATCLSACSSVRQATQNLAGGITPYKVPIIQGNFVSREQLEQIKPGMPRAQVKDILGTPLVTSVFHADRWDYVFTLRRDGVPPQSRQLSLFFKGELLERYEGDTLPSEAEFVAQIDSRRKLGKVPDLQASEEALKAFASKPAAASTPAALPGTAAAAPRSYPPLEP